MLKLLKITGQSLSPEYSPGDYVVVSNLFRNPAPGDVIAFNHKSYGTMIKKVDCISPGGREYFVTGTHPDSVDSRHFGEVSTADILGKVLWHIRRN